MPQPMFAADEAEMLETNNNTLPNPGDVIACRDGDVGVVVSSHWKYDTCDNVSLMVEIAWSSGKTYVDPWRSQDFSTSQDMFRIVSKA